MINEQDIFYYVFFRHSLSLDKIDEIEKEYSFKEAINFYELLKKNLSDTPDFSTKRKLAEKISAYTLQRVFILHPDKVTSTIKRKKSNILAANSLDGEAKVITKTFTDRENNYLIRTVSTGGITKVYVFSFAQSIVKNYTIALSPSMEKYHVEDNTKPLLLKKDIIIDSISIEFQLPEEKIG